MYHTNVRFHIGNHKAGRCKYLQTLKIEKVKGISKFFLKLDIKMYRIYYEQDYLK